jgi:alpha-galactosidase
MKAISTRGEYVTANATQFPDGMRFVAHHILRDGLTVGLWTAPFEVSSRAWVYEHHKDAIEGERQ